MATRTKQARNALRAVAYLRVSTDDQSLGVEAQRTSIQAWAVRNGVDVCAWHADNGVSGASPVDQRPGLLEALAALETNDAGVLVVAKRDRLARDVVIAAGVHAMVERGGAVIASCDGVGDGDGPEARLMRTLVDAFAEYERALIRSRTLAALAVKRAKGERVGTVAYGFSVDDDGQTLVENETEQAVIREIASMRANGKTFRAIVAHLNKTGAPCRGKAWRIDLVHRLATRAA